MMYIAVSTFSLIYFGPVSYSYDSELVECSQFACHLRTGPWQLALCRFSSGIAIGAAVPPIFALAEELIHPRQRRHRSSMAVHHHLVDVLGDRALKNLKNLIELGFCHK